MSCEQSETASLPFSVRLELFITNTLFPRLFTTFDCTLRVTFKQQRVINPNEQVITTYFTTGNLMDPRDGFFFLARKEESGLNDRIIFFITRQKDILPALLYSNSPSLLLSKLPGRTTFFTLFTAKTWIDANLQEQRTDLSNPAIQLWDIKPDSLPEELKPAFENGKLNISKLIELAYQNGFYVYISNQGSFLRGPLPIPGWIAA